MEKKWIASPLARFTLFTVAGLVVAFTPSAAFADGALTNGANHTGTIEIGGLDTWTFTATKNDSITVSIGEIDAGASDPRFYPWIHLHAPDGSDLGGDGGTSGAWGTTSAHLDVRAPSTGTYTVLVADYPNQTQIGTGSYLLTLAKSPGPYAISPGDDGGPMTNSVSHAGRIYVGDVDTWIFRALQNDSITISIGEVSQGGEDPDFYPWIRVRGPDGSDLGGDGATAGDWGTNAAQVTFHAPAPGIYTVLVADYPYQRQQGTGSYGLTGSGLRSVGLTLSGILAVVASTKGNGAFFRTSVQIHNPRATPISGKFVMHFAGKSGSANDPALTYTLNGGQTTDYPDILSAMGVPSGLGSLDVFTTGDPIPVMAARVFSDAGESGTAGFFLDPLAPEAALQAGESGVVIGPSDTAKARLNLGIRSLETGASLRVTVRDRSGVTRAIVTKNYGPNYFEQVSANAYVGIPLDGSDTITFAVQSGKAIVYGAQTDNKTQDPSVAYAKKSF